MYVDYDNWKLQSHDETPFEYECERCGCGCSEVYEQEKFFPPHKGGDEIEMVCLECFEKINHIK